MPSPLATPEAAAQQRALRWIVRLVLAVFITLVVVGVLTWGRSMMQNDQIAQILGGSLSVVTLADVFWFSRRKRP